MHDKATGESRGFAFVDFESVESAVETVQAFVSRPLVLEHRAVTISYADGYRRRSPDNEPRGGSSGSRFNGDMPSNNQHHEGWQPRPDWICDECNVTNFARRTSCFQCKTPRTAETKEVPVTAAFRQDHMRTHNESLYGDSSHSGQPFEPHSASSRDGERNARRCASGNDSARSIPPSQVLVVRKLPLDMEEGELHVAFAEFDGVQDIRLIRDRVTNVSRGFGFVEFRDIDAATNALKQCDGLLVQNTYVEVSYARDTLSNRSQYSAEQSQGPHAGSSMAVTALEQAQWLLSQGRGADTAQNDQSIVADDISALLDSAAAEVVPHFEEPKKLWPPPFETAGGSYVYASEFGLYWDPDSMFYYDAHTKLYHNSFTGTYYRCVNASESGAAAFQVFVPPPPTDAAAYNEASATTNAVSSKPALSLSLKKDKKKMPGISFDIKTTAFGSISSVFEKTTPAKTAGSGSAAHVASAVSVTSVGMKRKSADDIAKWSQRQREAEKQGDEDSSMTPIQQQHVSEMTRGASTIKQNESAKPNASSASSSTPSVTADSVIDALTSVPQEVPICLLCRRKFGSLEMLHKHEKLSKLHLTNLAKAKENKQHIAAQYRQHEKEMERDAKKQRREEHPPPNTTSGSNWNVSAPATRAEPSATSLESGIGGKMLKMMGWKSGEGLGKHGTGITAPIKAAGQGGRSDTAGLGLKAPLSASVDLSNVTSDKERRQLLARARYDADNA